MSKRFSWKDLAKLRDKCPDGSRTKDVLTKLLAGATVDIVKYGPAPYRSRSKRSPASFRMSVKRSLRLHDGVEIDGNLVFIPELQKPKSFLRDV